ncbi:MAG: hypothetical protein ABII79_12480 [bacterium]
MENQTKPLGLSGSAWGVIGIVAAVVGLLVICAFVVLAFGVDIGSVL